MPNLMPSDATETAEAWRVALTHTAGPVGLVFTRQKLTVIDRTRFAPAAGLAQGAYVLADTVGSAHDVILIATGSEVSRARSPRAARGRGHPLPGCLDAFVGIVRGPTTHLPRQRPAAVRPRSRQHRGCAHSDGSVMSVLRGHHRRDPVRRVCTWTSCDARIRLHPRTRRGYGDGGTRTTSRAVNAMGK
jgi:hypothetical protein